MPQKYCKNNYLYYFFAVIFFAYLHTPGLNLILILIRVPISALYAYAYKNTGKLSISIALHIAYNIIPCIFSLILLF
jgi:membrane protease YdiL (CAAX protease family)